MSVFESGVTAGERVGPSRFSANADAEARRPVDFIGRAHVARVHNESVGSKVWRFVAPVFRLAIPVVLLIASGAVAFGYSNLQARWLPLAGMNGQPFSLGFVLMPVTFFAVHLANRRYGASYASAQILLAWTLSAVALPFAARYLPQLSGGQLPALRETAGFGGALLVSQFLAAWTFDGARGRRWWTAPLMGSLIGGFALALIGYPAAYYGTGVEWTAAMGSYLVLTSAAAVALLIPYWLLRAAVPPTSGFNGY